jgi:hypothetical protein
MRRATLAGHVAHVVSVRAEEQVTQVDARPVVAPMQNEQPVRDWPNKLLPDPLVRGHLATVNLGIRVTVRGSAPRPLDTARPALSRPTQEVVYRP